MSQERTRPNPPLALPERTGTDSGDPPAGTLSATGNIWHDGDTRVPGADDQSSRRASALQVVLLTATTYAVLAWGGLQVAIAPADASPFYPAAGLALGAALVYGWPAIFGAALGATVIHLALGPARDLAGNASIWLPLAVGFSVGLQALAGQMMIKRWVQQPLVLVNPPDILRFFALACLSCLVSASAATWGLAQAGIVSGSTMALTFAQWLAGDAVGVLIATPITLTVIGRPRGDWIPRRRSLGLSMAVIATLMALAIMLAEHNNRQLERAAFRDDAAGALSALAHRADDLAMTAHWAWALAVATARDTVGADTPPPLAAEGGFNVALYGPATIGSTDLRRQRTLKGSDDALPERLDANRLNAVLAQHTARVNGEAGPPPSAMPSFIGIGPTIHRTPEAAPGASVDLLLAMRVANPAEQLATPGTAASPPSTHIVAVLKLDELVHAVRAGGSLGLRWCLQPLGQTPAGSAVGADNCATASNQAGWVHEGELQIGNWRWQVQLRPPPSSMERFGISHVWLLASVGLLATALFGAVMLTITGRTRRIQVAVKARTAQLEAQIRERNRTEAALRDSEQRFRNILNTVPIGVVYSDLDGAIRQANPKFCELLGYGPHELLHQRIQDFTDAEDRPIEAEFLSKLAAGVLPGYRLRKRYVAKDGRRIWVQAVVTALRDDAGHAQRIVGVAEDITEQLRLAESERARESAEAASLAKSEFLSRMSHELRTPLNAMLGFAQLLELNTREPLTPSQRPWVSQIQHAGWHLLDMINDLLDLSRIEAGTLRLQIEPVLLEPLVHDCVALVEQRAAKRRIRIEVRLPASGTDAPLQVLGDATRIKQILTNLLTNAIKYNVDRGHVRIEAKITTRGDGTPAVALQITDTGIGLTAQQVEQLFQPFNRLGREQGHAEGTGIGLVISHRLAELMSGELSASSQAGRGSTFSLILGAATVTPAMREPANHAPALAPAEYRERRLLYIEDNETNVEVMRGILAQRPQVRLAVATTGTEGLQALRACHFDLVLLDMHLPDMIGLSVLERMQADGHLERTCVVAVSADAMQDQIDAALRAGAAHYLTKPLSVPELLGIVDERLEAVDTQFG